MASFKFTSEAVSSQMMSDVQALNAFSDDQLDQFVGVTLAFISQDPSASVMLGAFAEEHGVNSKALNNTIRGIMYFFAEALKNNLSSASVAEDLTKLGLMAAKADLLGEKWQRQVVGLSQQMISKTLTVNELVDLGWRFGATAATSEVGSAGTTFLQLKLAVDNGADKESYLMELTLPQFYQFLTQMQKASSQM